MEKEFDLAGYMREGIEQIIKDALKASLKNPLESAFLMKFMSSCKKADRVRNDYENRNIHIPPFLIAGITSSCNLFCKGCYARENHSCGENKDQNHLSIENWGDIFKQAEDLGISFILLAGGEPLMRKEIILKAAEHEKILFPVFTNGTMIDDAVIQLFHKNRNLLPILSIEGNEKQTDDRRGEGTYKILIDAMKTMQKKGIFYGVSITVTTENISTVTDREYLKELYEKGCKVIFYVEYVPVTSGSEYLAPGENEREMLEREQNRLRGIFEDMIFISFPGDEKYSGGCLAAGRGFFYIDPDGDAQPCPFSAYSDTNLKNKTLLQALESPLFKKLENEGILSGEHSGGCVLFDKDDQVKNLMIQ